MKFRLCILPLVGGILTLLGLNVPAWYSITSWEENLWITGKIEHIFGSESIFDILPNEMFIPSIITTIVISFCSAVIIISVFLSIMGKKYKIKPENLWLMMGIIEVCAMLIYIYALSIGFYNYATINFWTVYDYNFGIIIPFISGSLAILGAITNKTEYWIKKRKIDQLKSSQIVN